MNRRRLASTRSGEATPGSRTSIAGLLLLAFLAVSGRPQTVSAQQPAPTPPRYVLHENVQEVLLYCTVLDNHKHLVTGLDQAAFTVSEDKRPATIVHFSDKDVPVSLQLVLDDSGSMQGKRPAVQSAAIDLIQASNPEDETAVTNFADAAYLDQDFTGDLSLLKAALGKSGTVSGGTALFDTVIGAAGHLESAAHHSKQVIVIVTDGRDNASAADLSAAIRRVQTANGPVIYTIGLLYDVSFEEARHARHDLQALSDETGGIAFFPSSVAEVDAIATEVAKDIRNQYTIAYRPPSNSAQSEFHVIAVKAVSPHGGRLVVRTRKGYFRAATPATNH